MKGRRFTVNSRKYDLSVRKSWSASLLELTSDGVLLEGYFAEPVDHSDLGIIDKGTRSVERFRVDLWYNHFVFYQFDGRIRNHYINISLPPTIHNNTVDYIDLDIDIILWPDGRHIVVDLDEFERNSRLYKYPNWVYDGAVKTKDAIMNDPSHILHAL